MNSPNRPSVAAGAAAQTAGGVPPTDTAETPCPYCYGPVVAAAQKCRHCGEFLDPALEAEREREAPQEKELSEGPHRRRSLPVKVAVSALAAVAVVSTLAVTVWGSPGTGNSEAEDEYLVGVQNLISTAQSQSDLATVSALSDEDLLAIGWSFCSGLDNGQDSITAIRQSLEGQSVAASEALVLAAPSSAVLHLCPEHEDEYFEDLANLTNGG